MRHAADVEEAVLRRRRCQIHAARRAGERGFTDLDTAALEERLRRMRPAFERNGRRRHEIIIRRARERITAVYDTSLDCLVTVYPLERRSR